MSPFVSYNSIRISEIAVLNYNYFITTQLVSQGGDILTNSNIYTERTNHMDNNQKAYIYLDSKGVLQKAGDIEGLFSKSFVKVNLKDTVLKMEPVENIGKRVR